MFPYTKTALSCIGAVGIIGIVFFILTQPSNTERGVAIDIASSSASGGELATTSEPILSTSTPKQEIGAVEEEFEGIDSTLTIVSASAPILEKKEGAEYEIARVQNLYPYAPKSFEELNLEARAAIVNIFCSTGSIGGRSVIGSGVLIDSRGIILTNAHVAQYVLLSEDPRVNLSCVIRHGSPARALWEAEVVYIPSVWVEKHAEEIIKEHSTGTGEHDYAFLHITKSLDGSPLPEMFFALPPDTRQGTDLLGAAALTVSYPAEFLSGAAAQTQLYPLTSIATIGELLTFYEGSVDLISVGGVAGAQGGSSGGGVVNAWGYLVGIISTTSEGATTAERVLRAITLNYIDRDLSATNGSNLAEFLSGDIATRKTDFTINKAPALLDLLIAQLAY